MTVLPSLRNTFLNNWLGVIIAWASLGQFEDVLVLRNIDEWRNVTHYTSYLVHTELGLFGHDVVLNKKIMGFLKNRRYTVRRILRRVAARC